MGQALSGAPADLLQAGGCVNVLARGWVSCRPGAEEAEEREESGALTQNPDRVAVLLAVQREGYLVLYEGERSPRPQVVLHLERPGRMSMRGSLTLPTGFVGLCCSGVDAITGDPVCLDLHPSRASPEFLIDLSTAMGALQSDPTGVVDLLHRAGLSSYLHYPGLLIRNGFDTPQLLAHATLDDLKAIGLPLGHARAIVASVLPKDSPPPAPPLPAPSLVPEPAFEPTGLRSEEPPSEAIALLHSIFNTGPSPAQQDLAVKAAIYSAKLIECEAELKRLRGASQPPSRNTSFSTPPPPPSPERSFLPSFLRKGSRSPREGSWFPNLSGEWKVDESMSESIEGVLRELKVPPSARKVLVGLDVVYKVTHTPSRIVLEDASQLGSSTNTVDLDNVPREVRSDGGKTSVQICGSVDPDGSVRIVTDLPDSLGRSVEVRSMLSRTKFVCDTALFRGAKRVAGHRRYFFLIHDTAEDREAADAQWKRRKEEYETRRK